MSRVVAHRYARALFELARDRQKLDVVEQELSAVTEILNDHAELRKVLMHPQVGIEAKKEILTTLFSGKISEESMNFLQLIVDRRREQYLGDVTEEYIKLANEARGVADATVISARELNDTEQKQIADQFGKKLKKTLRVQSKVDPSIIGGLVIRIGDRLYDGSVAGKLAQFQHQLKHS